MTAPPAIQPPTRPLTGSPTTTISDTLPLYLSTSVSNGPWWFGSKGDQRFDLKAPRGTCYVATDVETALRERGRERLLLSGVIPPKLVEAMDIYELRLPHTMTMADTTGSSAVKFGANRELATVADYAVPQAWSEALEGEGYEGMTYASGFTSAGQWNAVAAFGYRGEARWPIVEKKSGRLALVDAGLEDLIEDHPTYLAASIIPTPPPIR